MYVLKTLAYAHSVISTQPPLESVHHSSLKVHGPIYQNGVIYVNDASSPRHLGFKFQFDRLKHLDADRLRILQ